MHLHYVIKIKSSAADHFNQSSFLVEHFKLTLLPWSNKKCTLLMYKKVDKFESNKKEDDYR